MKGPTTSYCSMVDEALVAKAAQDNVTMDYPLRPSASGYCGRKLAYELAAYEGLADYPRIVEEKRPNVLRLLSLGHFIEDQALKYLDTLPDFQVRYKQQEVDMFTLPSGRLISGSVDAVMWSEEHKGLLDVKSVGNGWAAGFKDRWSGLLERYDKLESTRRINNEPNAWWVEDPSTFLAEVGEDAFVANMVQINLYACSDFMRSRGIDHAVIYRYEKNSSQHMEIRFRPCERLFKATKQKFEAIEAAVAEKSPEKVAKDYALGSLACAYCPYQRRCWPDASKKDHFAGAPKKQWAVRVDELEKSVEVKKLFQSYLNLEKEQEKRAKLAEKIILLLDAHGVRKVKLEDGGVWEVKELKSPKPHLSLRRGKE